MSDPHVSPLIVATCKRGHPRTFQTTFERKAKIAGKLYIVRECRICHSERNNRRKYARNSTSKWKRFLTQLEEAD
jgi:hypothetical protein